MRRAYLFCYDCVCVADFSKIPKSVDHCMQIWHHSLPCILCNVESPTQMYMNTNTFCYSILNNSPLSGTIPSVNFHPSMNFM